MYTHVLCGVCLPLRHLLHDEINFTSFKSILLLTGSSSFDDCRQLDLRKKWMLLLVNCDTNLYGHRYVFISSLFSLSGMEMEMEMPGN